MILLRSRAKEHMAKHPQQITTAETALDDDLRSRIIKYSITMGIRTACFVATYIAFRADAMVLMWIFMAGAVLLPYPAVIFANAGRERSRDDRSALLDEAPQLQLPPTTGPTVTETGETIDEAGAPVDTDPSAAEADPAPPHDPPQEVIIVDENGQVRGA